jgi:hypothetical protein
MNPKTALDFRRLYGHWLPQVAPPILRSVAVRTENRNLDPMTRRQSEVKKAVAVIHNVKLRAAWMPAGHSSVAPPERNRATPARACAVVPQCTHPMAPSTSPGCSDSSSRRLRSTRRSTLPHLTARELATECGDFGLPACRALSCLARWDRYRARPASWPAAAARTGGGTVRRVGLVSRRLSGWCRRAVVPSGAGRCRVVARGLRLIRAACGVRGW